jgi:hypothetical protein
MADNYDKSTVEPFFPTQAVSGFERVLMKEYGFNLEITKNTDGDTVYFYAPDGLNEEIEDFDTNIVTQFARLDDPIAVDLMRFAKEQDASKLAAYISSQYSWELIIQGILNKPECNGIKDVCVMGAYTCSKMRPGAFGGWVTRITRDNVQYAGTFSALQDMRDEDGLLAALDIVYQLADSNCLDQENGPDDPDAVIDDESAGEFRRQRDALNLVHDYMTNHPSVR